LVSLVPSLTEAVFRLRAGELLVGRTEYCVRPEGRVESVPAVGGTKNPDVGRIEALEPDLVLASREENTRHRIQRIAARRPVLLTDPRSPTDVPILWRELGEALGRPAVAEGLALEVESELRRAAETREERPPRFLCWVWRDPWMAAGPDTYVSALLESAGWSNALSGGPSRYPRLAPTEALRFEPDALLFLSEPFEFRLPRDLEPFGESFEADGDRFRFASGPTALRADGELLAWYPAQTADGLRYAVELRDLLLAERA